MNRISTDMTNNDMQYYLRVNEKKMNDLQNKMAQQTRIRELRDDPIAAAHSTRFQSFIYRLNRYEKNIGTVQDRFNITENYMQEAVSILHRIRELGVQGASSTFSREQKQYMGEEVDQLLNELVEIGNATSGDGTTLFSGEKTDTLPFRIMKGHVPGGSTEKIVSVDYVGDIAKNQVEISEKSYIKANFPGNEVFWAEHQVLISNLDASAYQVQQNTEIRIDGKSIKLTAGDNITAIIAKINDAGLAVKAGFDPVKNSLTLQTTTPHQLWLEDTAGSTVLADLGLISDLSKPPQNLRSDAVASGGSLFDMVMFIRDRLLEGDSLEIGGAGLKGIDLATENVLNSLAQLGAQSERMDLVSSRLSRDLPKMVERNSHEKDLDMAKAITEFKMLEYTHKATLQSAARILQPTLLDYLR